jgi:hypothetical protein
MALLFGQLRDINDKRRRGISCRRKTHLEDDKGQDLSHKKQGKCNKKIL